MYIRISKAYLFIKNFILFSFRILPRFIAPGTWPFRLGFHVGWCYFGRFFFVRFSFFFIFVSFHASLLQAPGLFVLDFMLAGVTLVAFFLFAFLFFLFSYPSTLHCSRHLVFSSWISCWLVLLWYLNLLFLSFYRLIF